MSEQLKYCLGCMKSIPFEAVVCPHCGFNEETVQHTPYLDTGNIIMEKYLVGKLLSASADTATYIGANLETGETVTIHEFLPEKIVTRGEGQSEVTVRLGYDSMFSNCLQSFLNLWRGLDVFKDAKCLPDVKEIVDYNCTVYAICGYKDAITLREYFNNCGTPLTWARAFSAFKPIMYALKKLNYAGIIHGNLNPDTILVGADGKLHITGFSIPQCHSGVAEFSHEPASGFAPVEIYEPMGATAVTDIYSVTALLYYCITLITPPDALSRVIQDTATLPAAIASTLSRGVIDGLIHGLSVHPENRFSNFDDLLNALTPTVPPKSETEVQPTQQPVKELTDKEEIDREIEEELHEAELLRQEKKESASAVSLGIRSFLAGFLVCGIIFCTLYVTVLYKNHPVDFLDNIFSSFSFLPMNKKEPTTTAPSTTLPAPTEPKYVTVADFVSNHTYDSIVSNPVFKESYNFKFEYEDSMTVPKNAVIRQSIAPGESVLSGVEITLVISNGTTKIKLPDMTGLNYIAATNTLESIGFKVKYELLSNNGTHTVGEVFAMDKDADGLYDKETVVTLKVWGKAPETTTSASTTQPTTTQPTTEEPSTTDSVSSESDEAEED